MTMTAKHFGRINRRMARRKKEFEKRKEVIDKGVNDLEFVTYHDENDTRNFCNLPDNYEELNGLDRHI